MRKAPNLRVEKYRITSGPSASDKSLGNNGAFMIPHRGINYLCIASDGQGWEHVSVWLRDTKFQSLRRLPGWEEMCWVKDTFFRDDETVIQYHPAKDDYVDYAKYCLHLWRPLETLLPKPPPEFVAVQGDTNG